MPNPSRVVALKRTLRRVTMRPVPSVPLRIDETTASKSRIEGQKITLDPSVRLWETRERGTVPAGVLPEAVVSGALRRPDDGGAGRLVVEDWAVSTNLRGLRPVVPWATGSRC